jgi:hypothetical protein
MLILLIEVLLALAAARLVVEQAEVAYVASKGVSSALGRK